MLIALVLILAWLAVGGFVLAAIISHGGRPDLSSIVAVLSVLFIVVCWPVIVWEHANIVCRVR